MMNKSEIIERLKNIAEHAVHTVGERPFIMSLDDGIAVHEAIELLTNLPEIPDSCNAETVEAIPVDWIGEYLAWLKGIGGYGLSDARAIQSMIIKWKTEHTNGCGPDYCDINFGGGTKA